MASGRFHSVVAMLLVAWLPFWCCCIGMGAAEASIALTEPAQSQCGRDGTGCGGTAGDTEHGDADRTGSNKPCQCEEHPELLFTVNQSGTASAELIQPLAALVPLFVLPAPSAAPGQSVTTHCGESPPNPLTLVSLRTQLTT